MAVGLNAGTYGADGIIQNTSASESIFIGRNSRANADGESNQIVIGDSSIGKGANTAMIGNDDTTDVYLEGNGIVDSLIIGQAKTFATLPAGVTGQVAYITDASTISYRAIAAGGGADYALVTFDGTNWIYH